MQRPPPTSTLFPYTTLFRSRRGSCPAAVPACSRSTRARSPRRSQPSPRAARAPRRRSEEHTSELQSQSNLVCRLLLEKKKIKAYYLANALFRQNVNRRERE